MSLLRCSCFGWMKEAAALTGLAVALGIGADLVLPQGVLQQTAMVLRDLELQVPVHLWQPAQVAAAVESGEIVLLDARPPRDFQALRVSGSLHAPVADFEDMVEELAVEVAGQQVVVLLPSEAIDEARHLAQRVVTDLGAEAVGTLDGGIDALWETDVPREGKEAP